MDCGRQLRHVQNPRQQRIEGDEAQLVQPREPDLETHHDRQHELVQVHDAGEAVHRQRLLHQRPESEFLQHGGYGQ